jgi:hypothetical protein
MNRLALFVVLLVCCAPSPTSSPPRPLASRLWPFAFELCVAEETWPACFAVLRETRQARESGSIAELERGAALLCERSWSWERCFARLEAVGGEP